MTYTELKQNNYKDFFIDEYIEKDGKIKQRAKRTISKSNKEIFYNVCEEVRQYFDRQLKSSEGEEEVILDRQKKALIGVPDHVNYFKGIIKEYLEDTEQTGLPYPEWYENLIDGIFHEVWGLAGISEWLKIPESQSAKIIGERIYFLIDGKMVLKKQTISSKRFQSLKKALLLLNPDIPANIPNVEILMYSGERVTIYDDPLTKSGQNIMVFRKYVISSYTLEKQAERGTIPAEAVEMFRSFAKVGFNILFSGAVRTAKTTLLTTFQLLEDPGLEGVLIESNPEIPLHELMPDAPIMQIIADGEELEGITKKLMRSDGDYIICGEARDGNMLSLLVDIANRGTRHCKSTIHLTDVYDLSYDIANMIIASRGGSLEHTIIKVAKSFHYIFSLIQLPDRSKKRLKGVYEVRYDNLDHSISIIEICSYDFKSDSWSFYYDIGNDKEEIAIEENYNEFLKFKSELKRLSEKYPKKNPKIVEPFYSRGHKICQV
jgi:pilus assembly protein CpaF